MIGGGKAWGGGQGAVPLSPTKIPPAPSRKKYAPSPSSDIQRFISLWTSSVQGIALYYFPRSSLGWGICLLLLWLQRLVKSYRGGPVATSIQDYWCGFDAAVCIHGVCFLEMRQEASSSDGFQWG